MEFNSSDFDDFPEFDITPEVITSEPDDLTVSLDDNPSPSEDTVDDSPTDPPVSTSEPDEIATKYYEFLREQAVLNLPEDFEFDGSPEKVEEALLLTKERTKEQIKQSMLAQVSPELHPALEYILDGGKSLQDVIAAYNEPDFDNADLDNEEHQRAILFEYYSQTSNYTPEKINKIIDRLSPEDLADEARETVDELKQLAAERKATLAQQAKLEREAEQARIQKETEKLTSLIDESKSFDEARKNRLKTFMFVPVNNGQTRATQLATTMQQVTSNPEHLIQLADILADYNPKSGFSMDRIKKQLKTQTNQSFKDYLHSKVDPKSQMKGGIQQKPENDVNWDEYFKY